MVNFNFLALAWLVSAACANPLLRDFMMLHEKREQAPQGFSSNGPASADTILDLRIAMVPNNIAGLEEQLMAVSTPSSASYGQHLTREEVAFRLFASRASVTDD